MNDIGKLVREKRLAKGMSAGEVARKLKCPITKQAFANRERVGRFSFDMVVEIAAILQCPMSDFYTIETINCFDGTGNDDNKTRGGMGHGRNDCRENRAADSA